MSLNPNLLGADNGEGPTRIRILAPDNLVVDALGGALSEVPGIEIVAGEGAHVILWDTGPDKPSTRNPLQPAAADSGLPVLALAHDEAHANALLALGARGAVLRQASAMRLAAAATAIRHGLYVLDIELAGTNFGAVMTPTSEPEVSDSGESGLTARERDVLALLALGLSNKSIARRLQVSIHTIKFHVNSILSKLDADSRTAAVTTAVRRGLVSL
jgi:DNA-binding NarL/FixJ family response regulator